MVPAALAAATVVLKLAWFVALDLPGDEVVAELEKTEGLMNTRAAFTPEYRNQSGAFPFVVK